jgi:DNA repair exonuclease SbcCD ATPase subunit
MHLLNLKAANFLSFKELDYNFQSTPILIQGENLSEDNQESNGSGKSSLQAAIEFCLFSSTSRKVRDSELIFFGENQAVVELSIKCPIRNQILSIKRVIKKKGSNELSISINDIDSEYATVNDGNKLIIDWIGISKDDLQNYFIINKERYKSFFSSSNKEKVEMINRFSNAKLIDGVDKEVQSDVVNLESELKSLERDKTSLIATITTLKDQITYELSRDLEAESKKEIDSLHDEIICLEEVIGSYAIKKIERDDLIKLVKDSVPEKRTLINGLNDQIKAKNIVLEETLKSLSDLNDKSKADDYLILDEKLSRISLKTSEYKAEKRTLDSNKREIEDILSDINKNITGSVKCPKCSHEFLAGDPTVDINEEKEAKISTEELLEKTKKSIDSIYTELDKLDKETSEVDIEKRKIKEEEDKIFQEKQKIQKSVDAINTEIKGFLCSITKYEDEIESVDIRVRRYDNDIVTYKDRIKQCESDIREINVKIEKAKDKEIDHKRIADIKSQMKIKGKDLYTINSDVRFKKDKIFDTSQWVFNFKKFNMHLANQSLKVIQGYCNKFLQSINSDIQVRWEGIKMLANGTLREEITPYIIRDSEERDFWSFSGGERGRMDYSLILTLQRMINSTHKYGGLDFLSTDEIAEGIDSQGLTDLMKALSTLQKTILITTHVVNRSVSSNILLVRKEKGISKLILN